MKQAGGEHAQRRLLQAFAAAGAHGGGAAGSGGGPAQGRDPPRNA